jgi:futalosine hydrolase
MKILLVAATKAEIEPFLTHFSFREQLPYDKIFGNYQVKVLIGGVGMVATAFSVGKALSEHHFDLAFNAGIAGTFKDDIKIGDVCNIKEDCFSELGAEDGDDFLSIESLGLGKSTYFAKPNLLFPKSNNLTSVRGITVNTVHGNENSISKIKARFNPDIESMEGAAFFYACEQRNTACIQIRAISNVVERRNRENWQIGLAIKNLNDTLITLFES